MCFDWHVHAVDLDQQLGSPKVGVQLVLKGNRNFSHHSQFNTNEQII